MEADALFCSKCSNLFKAFISEIFDVEVNSDPVQKKFESDESDFHSKDIVIDGSQQKLSENERKQRFLLYWTSTTIISTSTSTTYTVTSTLATLECTPSNFAYSSCGK